MFTIRAARRDSRRFRDHGLRPVTDTARQAELADGASSGRPRVRATVRPGREVRWPRPIWRVAVSSGPGGRRQRV